MLTKPKIKEKLTAFFFFSLTRSDTSDIKPENLLISHNDVLKLCDFGKFGRYLLLIVLKKISCGGVLPYFVTVLQHALFKSLLAVRTDYCFRFGASILLWKISGLNLHTLWNTCVNMSIETLHFSSCIRQGVCFWCCWCSAEKSTDDELIRGLAKL